MVGLVEADSKLCWSRALNESCWACQRYRPRPSFLVLDADEDILETYIEDAVLLRHIVSDHSPPCKWTQLAYRRPLVMRQTRVSVRMQIGRLTANDDFDGLVNCFNVRKK